MRIYIRGKNEKICKKEVKEIVNFFGTHLLGPRLNKNITLEIIYRHDFKDDLYGLCGPVDWDEMRSFEMLLNPHIPKTKQINTLAHEMVHLKQFARGHLKQYVRGGYRWMGKFVDNLEYENLPWEKEANTKEAILMELYRRAMRQ